jgi:hypothetical protein
MRLIKSDGGPPATRAQIAALEFGPVQGLRDLSQRERLAELAELEESLHAPVLAAGEIIALDKAELIARTREPGDATEAVVTILADATARARGLVDVLISAECRLRVALANPEADEK